MSAKRTLQAAPGEPFPSRLQPMLARLAALPSGEEWGYEVKWDGVRVLGYADRGEWCLESRRLENVTRRYPELAAIASAAPRRSFVLDGEVVALDEQGRPSFQLLQRRMGLTSAGVIERRVKETPVIYMVFDLLHLDGHCVRDLPYTERRNLLTGLGLGGERWQTPRHHVGDGQALLEAARSQGLEGVVAKRLDSPYRPGKRTGEWVKVRNWRRQEFVIGGWTPGEGVRAGRVGALLVGHWDLAPEEARERGEEQRLIYAGGVGSGLTEEMLGRIGRLLEKSELDESPFAVGGPKRRDARFCRPQHVCDVQFSEWTREGTLRQPSFKGLREDKDPREVIREDPLG